MKSNEKLVVGFATAVAVLCRALICPDAELLDSESIWGAGQDYYYEYYNYCYDIYIYIYIYISIRGAGQEAREAPSRHRLDGHLASRLPIIVHSCHSAI